MPLLLLISILAGVLHVPSLLAPHFESDEVILTFLAERLRAEPLNYSLRKPLDGPAARRFMADTWAHSLAFDRPPEQAAVVRQYLESLPQADVLHRHPPHEREYAFDPDIYDRPMFFHPPVFPYLLAACRAALGGVGGPLLALLAHLASIVLIGLIGRRIAGEPAGLAAAILMAIDPVAWLDGSRVWIDALLQANLAAALLVAIWAVNRGGRWPFVAAGLLFGIACLTKLPAVLAGPALVAIACLAPRRPSLTAIALFAFAAALLVAPWLLLTRFYYGAWLPAAHPTEWLMSRYPYVRLIVNRPALFYVVGLLLAAPIYVYAAPSLFRLRREPALWIPLAWAVSTLGGLTLLGLAGWGYQLRYLSPATPALCLLAGAALARARWWALPAVLLAPITFWSGWWSSSPPPMAEVYPRFAEYCLTWAGTSLPALFNGMW